MKKIIPVLIALSLFAAPAFAGQTQIMDYDIEWISSCSHYSNYQWQVDLRNTSDRPQKIHLKLFLYDKDGNVIDEMYRTVYIRSHEEQIYAGNCHVSCQPSEVADTKAEIVGVQTITH